MSRLNQLLTKAQASHLTVAEQIELKELHAKKMGKITKAKPEYPDKDRLNKFKFPR